MIVFHHRNVPSLLQPGYGDGGPQHRALGDCPPAHSASAPGIGLSLSYSCSLPLSYWLEFDGKHMLVVYVPSKEKYADSHKNDGYWLAFTEL